MSGDEPRTIRLSLLASTIAVGLVVATLLCGSLLPRAHASDAAPETETIAPYRERAGHQRPVIAVIGQNEGTETTDYVIPYSVLSESGAADVFSVATGPGPIQMHPALKILPQTEVHGFDLRFPEGADYVFVPAVHHPDDAALIAWVRAQAGKGAVMIGVCDGVWVLANAGVLKGHRATGHWYSLDSLEHKFHETKWVRNRRYVADGTVVTTTGVTASIPVSLALVQAITGTERAKAVAQEVGATDWSSAHDSLDFGFDTRLWLTAASNTLSFWSHEDVGIRLSPATDEIAVALIADAYSRTRRSQALTVADS